MTESPITPSTPSEEPLYDLDDQELNLLIQDHDRTKQLYESNLELAWKYLGSDAPIQDIESCALAFTKNTIHYSEEDPFIPHTVNKFGFSRRLEKEIPRILKGRGRWLALTLIDGDRFKEINDSLGHPIGDQILIATGEALVSGTRPEDLRGHIGGDEFAGAFKVKNRRDMIKVCRRIQEWIPNAVGGRIGKTDIDFTITMGTTFLRQGDTVNTLMKRADQVLYEAKKVRGVFMIDFGGPQPQLYRPYLQQ